MLWRGTTVTASMQPQLRIIAGLAVLLFGWLSTPVLASDASVWGGADKGKVRLIAGARDAAGHLHAGVQIVLDKGWKTYWRVPGDSGVPPSFKWDGSRNAADIEVLWPTPGRFRDDFGWNNGYKKEVVFPVRIRPEQADKPVHLVMTLYYGVCRELCIPGKAELELTLQPEGTSANQALIQRYLQAVPKPPEKVAGLNVARVEAEQSGSSVFLSVDVERKPGNPVSLFVEGPSKFYFEMPVANQTAAPDHARFRLRVDGAKEAADLQGAGLVFTAIQGDLRLEQPWQLN